MRCSEPGRLVSRWGSCRVAKADSLHTTKTNTRQRVISSLPQHQGSGVRNQIAGHSPFGAETVVLRHSS